VHEVQTRDRMDAKNLETTKEEKEILEIALKEIQLKRVEENKDYLSLALLAIHKDTDFLEETHKGRKPLLLHMIGSLYFLYIIILMRTNSL
jgi:hypothetical protein